jgi:hypothetical protein
MLAFLPVSNASANKLYISPFNDLITAILDVFRKSNIYGPKGKKNQNYQNMRFPNIYIGVKPLIHQSELGTYTKVVPFQEKSSFHFVVL